MAGVYRSGKSAKWVSWWYDEHGRRRSRSAFTDKALALDLARREEAECRQVREGLLPPGERTRREAGRKPIVDHVEAYRLDLLARGDTAKHASHVAGALRRLLDDAEIRDLGTFAAERITSALGRLRQRRSARTVNHALGAVKAFAVWLHDSDRIAEVPRGLRKIPLANEQADRKRVRRALGRDDLARLLAATEAGPDQYLHGPTRSKHHKVPVTGPERATLYRLAMGTGFRANELRSLTPESFALEGDRPTVTVEAAYSKNGKRAIQPITRELADALRPFVAGKPAGAPVLTVPEKTAQMLRRDLEAAGIPYTTEAGTVDFHALRGSYVTHLIQSGADIKTVQMLARHSTPSLTLSRYAHTDEERQRKALKNMGNNDDTPGN